MLFLEQTAPPSTSPTRAGTREFVPLLRGISGDGRSFCDFIRVHSEPRLHSGKMNQRYINITRNTFIYLRPIFFFLIQSNLSTTTTLGDLKGKREGLGREGKGPSLPLFPFEVFSLPFPPSPFLHLPKKYRVI